MSENLLVKLPIILESPSADVMPTYSSPEISFAMIPYAEKVICNGKGALRISNAPFELGSIKEVQRKLQREFDQIKAKKENG